MIFYRRKVSCYNFYKTLSDKKLYNTWNRCILFEFLNIIFYLFKSIIRFIDVQDYEYNENDIQTRDHLRIASMSLTNSLVHSGPGEVYKPFSKQK